MKGFGSFILKHRTEKRTQYKSEHDYYNPCTYYPGF